MQDKYGTTITAQSIYETDISEKNQKSSAKYIILLHIFRDREAQFFARAAF